MIEDDGRNFINCVHSKDKNATHTEKYARAGR